MQGTIEWNVKRQKEMFKGTFWGSLITVLISGYIADRTSPKWLFQIAFTIYVVTTVVFPFLVNHVGFEAAFASRVLMGIGEVRHSRLFFPMLIPLLRLFIYKKIKLIKSRK